MDPVIKNIEFIFPCIFFAIIIAGISGFFYERKQWNKGICAASGKPWRQFCIDSQCGRGYSDGAGNDCWISYPVDNVV